jgi:hypothetical protein
MGPDGEITRLITNWQRGAPGAEDALFNALYKKLHGIALQCLQGERPPGLWPGFKQERSDRRQLVDCQG